MEMFIIVLIFIVAFLLGAVVLIQNPKGGGLAVGFQGQQMGGVQETTDFLEKATWYLVAALFVLSLISASWFKKDEIKLPETAPTEQTAPQGEGSDQQAQP
jgi:preprotein translocase subunit SecG